MRWKQLLMFNDQWVKKAGVNGIVESVTVVNHRLQPVETPRIHKSTQSDLLFTSISSMRRNLHIVVAILTIQSFE